VNEPTADRHALHTTAAPHDGNRASGRAPLLREAAGLGWSVQTLADPEEINSAWMHW
jgi:hypothetical protein